VTPGDPDALAEAMLAYLAAPGRSDADGTCGRAFVEREFDRAAIASRFSHLLEAGRFDS
jgi:glycosyltransferase involved in cell wall biosynthesis